MFNRTRFEYLFATFFAATASMWFLDSFGNQPTPEGRQAFIAVFVALLAIRLVFELVPCLKRHMAEKFYVNELIGMLFFGIACMFALVIFFATWVCEKLFNLGPSEDSERGTTVT